VTQPREVSRIAEYVRKADFDTDWNSDQDIAQALYDVGLRVRDADDLGAAWAEAEAALPEGWAINLLWGTVTAERWGANAGPWPADPRERGAFGGGDTPAAALHALAAALRRQDDPREETNDG
jgi:hypothetical protein